MKVKQQWFRKVDAGSSSMKIQDIALAADGAGSLYFVGQNSEQERGVVLTKMSSSGAELWRKQVGIPQSTKTWAFALAVDLQGNVYITASGAQQDNTDAWLVKFSPDGTELWQLSLGAERMDWGIHLAADGYGSVYLAGASMEAAQSSGLSSPYYETWLAKISPSGSELWRRQLGRQRIMNFGLGAVAADWEGNVCFLGTADEPPPADGSAGKQNALAIKFSPDGAELWRREIGTVMNDVGTGLGMDEEGNIYLAGFTDGEMAAGGGGPQGGARDGWLMKLAPDGTEFWRKQMGTDKQDTIDALVVDGLGNIYLVGSTYGEMVAGGAQGKKDAWVARFSPGGTEQWRYQLGTAGEDNLASMAILWYEGNNRCFAVDGGGNIYLFGYVAGEWFSIKHAWLAKLYNVPESFEEMDELNRLRFQTLQQQISGT